MIARYEPTSALRSVALVAVFAYFAVVGGSAQGEVVPGLFLINAVIAAGLVGTYALHLNQRADKLDTAILASVLLFVAAALFSQFPRQSFDAALGALTYAAALFVLRGLMASAPDRAVAFRALMALSLLFTLAITARWVPVVLEWWALTGWAVVPPLDLNLSASPWGHRHDAALVVAILYPSWWMSRPSRRKAAVAVPLGLLVALIVIVDGSRTLWLALVVATAVATLPRFLKLLQRDSRLRVAAIISTGCGIGAAMATGIAGSLIDRLVTVDTLNARTAMWTALADLWWENPVVGVGPASFPWVLQLTDYFDENSWAPRHPDSLIFQLLPEAGLAGVAATALVAIALAPHILRAPTPAKWAVVAFAVACIGANPTDFGFLLAIVVVWVSIATPRMAAATVPDSVRWVRIGSMAALSLIGVAYGATVVAAFAYADARNQIHRGDLSAAASSLSVAMTMDPGMALYVRQRGTLHLLAGAHTDAHQLLSRATQMNPSDDLAWRALAAAHRAAGSEDMAETALRRAVHTQRSDPANLLFLAQQQVTAGSSDAPATIAEIVQAWPWISSAPGWAELLPGSLTPREAVELAIERWERGLESPGPFSSQALALVAVGGRKDLDGNALQLSRLGPRLGRTTLAVYRCEPEADTRLREASAAERRTHEYWSLVLTRASQRGMLDADALRLYEIMRGGSFGLQRISETLDVLAESGFSADTWGYRRLPITWPPIEPVLPSPQAGAAVWRLAAEDSGDAGIGC